jgi:hypothetical protein
MHNTFSKHYTLPAYIMLLELAKEQKEREKIHNPLPQILRLCLAKIADG